MNLIQVDLQLVSDSSSEDMIRKVQLLGLESSDNGFCLCHACKWAICGNSKDCRDQCCEAFLVLSSCGLSKDCTWWDLDQMVPQGSWDNVCGECKWDQWDPFPPGSLGEVRNGHRPGRLDSCGIQQWPWISEHEHVWQRNQAF